MKNQNSIKKGFILLIFFVSGLLTFNIIAQDGPDSPTLEDSPSDSMTMIF